jgi:hypothetical protein
MEHFMNQLRSILFISVLSVILIACNPTSAPSIATPDQAMVTAPLLRTTKSPQSPTFQKISLTKQPATSPTLTTTVSWLAAIEAENPDEYTTGNPTVWRSEASGLKVLGQFGCKTYHPYEAVSGYSTYIIQGIPATDHLFIILIYSKNSSSTTAIELYMDKETVPRIKFTPINQGNWNSFTKARYDLGSVANGEHFLRILTSGQQYGVADLDKIFLYE